MKVTRFDADECIQYRAEIANLLAELYMINLPYMNFSYKQGLESVYDLCRYLSEERAVFFAALDGEIFAGFLWAYPRAFELEKRLHLYHIAIISKYRANGIGGMLMDELELYAKQNHYVGIELLATSSNDVANRLYESKGFVTERIQLYKQI